MYVIRIISVCGSVTPVGITTHMTKIGDLHEKMSQKFRVKIEIIFKSFCPYLTTWTLSRAFRYYEHHFSGSVRFGKDKIKTLY